MGHVLTFDHQVVGDFDELLTVELLAKLIHKSSASVRSDASRNPSSLPPICRLPGNKRLLWRRQDVQSWLASFVQPSHSMAIPKLPETMSLPKRRGRPRKTEMRGAV